MRAIRTYRGLIAVVALVWGVVEIADRSSIAGGAVNHASPLAKTHATPSKFDPAKTKVAASSDLGGAPAGAPTIMWGDTTCWFSTPQPTNCGGGVFLATTCGSGGSWPTACPGGVTTPSSCPGGTVVPTICPSYTSPTRCGGGVVVPTACPTGTVATNCPFGSTIPTNCPGGAVAPTYCSFESVPKWVATACAIGTPIPTNCPTGTTPGPCPVLNQNLTPIDETEELWLASTATASVANN